ncbi:uncharacterized protein LOC129595845 [Paramacrobiotus metropolitanus]|uniref:uncharacterized protein LOC129595845 n=1 Tax=Paramacrobiotus metropolitanus TaxID=2943436 RepID=UPI002445899C|nr:uncharacterized protein LOC129595845 [Paramacrobiotus metropolitanus]
MENSAVSHKEARKNRRASVEKPSFERRSSVSGSDEEFQADIKAPGDLPLPESMLGHERVHTEITPLEESKKIVDEEFEKLEKEKGPKTWADVVAHNRASETSEPQGSEKSAEKIHSFPFTSAGDSVQESPAADEKSPSAEVPIKSLGPVDKSEAFANMQDFQKELVVEALQNTGTREKVKEPVAIKSLGPLDTPCEEFSHGFQKDLTLGGANTERPDGTESNVSTQPEPESDETQQKNFLLRAAEKVAAAAGTVVGLLIPAPSTEDAPANTPKEAPKEITPKDVEQETLTASADESFEEEKGLVDTAIEKVWNLITGKEELFPIQEDSATDKPAQVDNHNMTEEEFIQTAIKSDLNPNAAPFVPSGLLPVMQPEVVPYPHPTVAGNGMMAAGFGQENDIAGKTVESGNFAA